MTTILVALKKILNYQKNNRKQPKWIDGKTHVFIPIECYKIISLITQVNQLYTPIYRIIMLLQQFDAHIIGVGHEKPNFENSQPTNLDDISHKTTISNGTTIQVGVFWYYTLYVSRHQGSSYLDTFIQNLTAMGYTKQDICEGKINIQDDNDFMKLQSCATSKHGKKINSSTLNMHSLQVLSFPAKKIIKSQWKSAPSSCRRILTKFGLSHLFGRIKPINDKKNISCLYTGDNKLSNGSNYYEEMNCMLYSLFHYGQTDRIGLMQIPHHGSANNYPCFLPLDNNVRMSFVNAASNQKKKLFINRIINDYIIVRKRLFIITEEPYSKIVLIATW